MNVCSGKGAISHEEIVYESKNCPFCEYIHEMEGTLRDIQHELSDAKEDIKRLEES